MCLAKPPTIVKLCLIVTERDKTVLSFVITGSVPFIILLVLGGLKVTAVS